MATGGRATDRARSWCRIAIVLSVVYDSKCNGYDSNPFCSFAPPFENVHASSGKGSHRRFLFFRTVEPPRRRAPWRIPDAAKSDLQSGIIPLPYKFQLEYSIDKDKTHPSTKPNGTERILTVRYLETEDLANILPMCVTEFGPGQTAQIFDFPWDDLTSANISEWWERFSFVRLLELAMRLKIRRRKDGNNLFSPAKPDDNILCLQQDERVVGIVELSLEPPLAERNPPPWPIPMFVKELFCKQKGIPPPDGWVTNLLIDDRYRQLGYGKVLMWAAEGLARSWGCESVYLHTVADKVGGAIPQSLYRGLNYEPVVDQLSAEKFSWMGPELLNSGLYIVEGVPLLFLRKRLNTQ